MHTIVLTESKGYSPKATAILKKLGPVYTWQEAIKKPKILSMADILVVKLGMRISRKMMDRLPNLKIIATSTTGLNHIDVAEAEERGVNIVSLRGEALFLKKITPTAEETIGLMIGLMRKLPWGFDAVKRGEWKREKYYGNELYGRTLGIVGFGRLGSIVARYVRCFGMSVLAYDPNVSGQAMHKLGVVKANIRQVFKKSDVVSIHVLLTDKTHKLITWKHLRLMKPTAYFINTARGEIIDEKALLGALRKNQIAGAALDVLSGEDPNGSHIKKNPLVEYAKKHDNLFIVPHLGGASFDAMSRTEEFIAEKVVKELQ
ncbi:MAG: NAD(P)-dependent oxidoreductase [bacterium]|nr:NAD(P)-dependent oxidoreductase [bacterium]